MPQSLTKLQWRWQTINCKSVSVWYPEQLHTPYVDFGKVLRNAYGALTYLSRKFPVSHLEQHRIATQSVLVIFQIAEIETPCSRNTYPACPSMPYGALPETFPKIPQILATDAKRSTYKLSLFFWSYILATYSSTIQLCKVTTGYTQLTKYSKH